MTIHSDISHEQTRPQHLRRVLIVFNPVAGRGRRNKLNAVIDRLRAHMCAVTVMETERSGHAEEIARTVDPSLYDIVVAAGGDGTVNEIVNGLVGKSVALGVVPLGTANVLADEIGLGRKSADLADAIALGPLQPIRVGVANGRRFIMMAGAGFDAEVVDQVKLHLKRLVGPLAYVWEMVRQAFAYGFAGCRVDIDGVAYDAVTAIVCNGRSYGGPFTAAPEASLEDDVFHVVLFSRGGWFNVLRYGLALLTGRLPYLRDVAIVRGSQVVITGGEGAPVQADGDVLTRLPAKISIDPDAIVLARPLPLAR